MNPGHPLPTITDAPTQAELERQQQAFEHAAIRAQHQAGAHQHHANPQVLGALCSFFPGPTQLRGEIIGDLRRIFTQLTFTAVAVPTHCRARQQHCGALLAPLQPGQQLLGQTDPARPQQRLALAAPGAVGDGGTGQIDQRVQRLFSQLLEPGNASNIDPTETRDLAWLTAPDGQAVALLGPVCAKRSPDQTGTAGQQDMHGIVLAWQWKKLHL